MIQRKLASLVVLVAWAANDTAAAPLLLASDGKAALPVVISAMASEQTKAAAEELAAYLSKISGAHFHVRTGDGGEGIILGTLDEFPDRWLIKPLELRGTHDGNEAYVIRTEPERRRVRLIGATDLAASHAACRMLEILGCRWLFPAAEWEVVPSIRELSIDASVTDRPKILARRIWYGWGHFNDKDRPGKVNADYKAWARRNCMASSFEVHAGHAWDDLAASYKAEFDKHPEYFALVKGKRQGPQLCVSNEGVRKIAVQYTLAKFKRRPGLDMASMEAADGSGFCECDSCKRIGNGGVSDQVFSLANIVARAVAKEHPGKMVGVLAYHEHSEPPSFPLEPNVYVQLTAGFTTGRYTFPELMDLWPKTCRNMGFYEYFSVWAWDQDKLPGGRGADVAYIREQIRKYAARGATSIDAESGNNWGVHGRGYYVANRLMWDPDADVEALLADFYEKAFGPGAAAMKRCYERLDPGNKPLISRHLFALAYRDVEDASKLAAERPDVQARLDHVKQYLRYNHLVWLRDRERDKAKKKELALAVITHVYRTRYSYMNHWEAMRQSATPEWAKQYGEPAWSAHDPSQPKPWAADRPVTRDETERDFQEGLAYFLPEQVEEKTFSNDLVPVKWPAEKPPAASSQHYQGPARYALYSTTGEPLDLEVTPGTIAWYRDRADARYVLRDAKEQPVAEGRLKLDGEAHKPSLKVPAPGLYWFDFDDSAAGWKISVAAGRPASIVLRRDKPYSHQGHMQPMHFYVPKGTRQVQYFWSGGPHKVRGPDGRVIAEVSATGEFITIPVPDGTDGRAWHMTELALGHLWFFNVPNVLAASPEALLIPRELGTLP